MLHKYEYTPKYPHIPEAYNFFELLAAISNSINKNIKIIDNNETIILDYKNKKSEFDLDFFNFHYLKERQIVRSSRFNEYKNLVIDKLLNEQVITDRDIANSILNITEKNNTTSPIKQEIKQKLQKLNIKTLLQKILKDDKNFKVLKNSQKENKARIQNTETAEIIEIKPSEFGFEKGIRENKNLNESEIKEYKEKLSKLLSKNTINEKINKFNIKTLLQEILKNDNDFKVLKNSRQKELAIIQSLKSKEIFEIKPSEFDFKGLGDNKELNETKITKYKEKLFQILNIAKQPRKTPAQKENKIMQHEFKIKTLNITGDCSINEILNFRKQDNKEKFNEVRKLVAGSANIAISKYCKNINFTTPVKIEMSFKSELDVTNHLYVFKIIEDRLVKKGIIKNDDDTIVKEITLKKTPMATLL